MKQEIETLRPSSCHTCHIENKNRTEEKTAYKKITTNKTKKTQTLTISTLNNLFLADLTVKLIVKNTFLKDLSP